MTKDKTEISYWLKSEGGEESILSTETSKVPEKGDIIGFDHNWDGERANRTYEHLNEEQKKAFFPKSKKLIEGDYVVTSVKRYIKNYYIKTKISAVFEGVSVFSNSTGGTFINDSEVPISYIRECFEVFIEPIKEVEVATPISIVRNLFGPIATHFQLIKEKDNEIFFDQDIKAGLDKIRAENLAVCLEVIEELTKIVKDDKNW